MDLKRAWRNGFLVSLLLAVRLHDLAFDKHINPAEQSSEVPNETPHSTTADLVDGSSSFDNGAHFHELSISVDALNHMLLQSEDAPSENTRDAALQFDAQDLLQSIEEPVELPPARIDDIPRIADSSLRHGSSLSLIPAGSPAWARAHSAPFGAGSFTSGRKSETAGSGNPSSEESGGTSLNESTSTLSPDSTPAAEPDPDPNPPIDEVPSVPPDVPPDTTIPTDTSPIEVDWGIDNEPHQTVPEPSSLALLAIATIALSVLTHRKYSKGTPNQF